MRIKTSNQWMDLYILGNTDLILCSYGVNKHQRIVRQFVSEWMTEHSDNVFLITKSRRTEWKERQTRISVTNKLLKSCMWRHLKIVGNSYPNCKCVGKHSFARKAHFCTKFCETSIDGTNPCHEKKQTLPGIQCLHHIHQKTKYLVSSHSCNKDFYSISRWPALKYLHFRYTSVPSITSH